MKKFTLLKYVVSIFTLSFLLLTIIFFINSSNRLFISHSEYTVRHLAQEKANTIESVLNYAEGSIQLLANFVSSEMKERELKNPNAILSKYTGQIPFDFVEYIRWDGLNYMNSVAGSEPFDASERVYYKEGIKGNSGIWPNFKPKVANEVLLNFYTPLYFNDEISGVITGAIGETTSLKQKLTATFFGHQIQSFICNENFEVVSSVCENINPGLDLKKWTSIKLLADIIEHSENKNYEPFIYDFEGRHGMCCTSTIESNGWHVVVIVYPSVLKMAQSEISGNLFAISVLIIIIMAFYLGFSLVIQGKANKVIQNGLIISATRDELTGLLNRHAYEDDLRKLNSEKIEDDLIYVVFDVNGLKSANDNFGHEAGDELIVGAANCIKNCFGKFGKIYRTGGDEFTAMINASEDEIEKIKRNFEQETFDWAGEYSTELKIPLGYISKKENPKASIHEMSKIADQRMYKEKSLMYIASGIDRRAQNAAYEVLCTSYTKILKINLTDDDFTIIQMDSSEKNVIRGYSDKISEWLHNFGVSGQVFENDIDNFLEKTSLEYMRKYFASGNKELNIQYRRMIGDEFRKVLMEIKTAKEYTNENQSLYLYVKNIDKV